MLSFSFMGTSSNFPIKLFWVVPYPREELCPMIERGTTESRPCAHYFRNFSYRIRLRALTLNANGVRAGGIKPLTSSPRSGTLGGPLDLVTLLQPCNYTEILQSCGVAFDFAVGGELTEQATHDFAPARLGQHVGAANIARFSQLPNFFRS